MLKIDATSVLLPVAIAGWLLAFGAAIFFNFFGSLFRQFAAYGGIDEFRVGGNEFALFLHFGFL